MGRGPVVAQKQAATAAARWKIYGLHSKLIALAAQSGGNPEENPKLALAIARAKKDSVTTDVISRAIKRGTGEDKSGAMVEEIVYEGYAAAGVAVVARALTDNRNRTISNLRHTFTKNGGSLGEAGSVTSFAFSLKGVVAGKLNVAPESFEESVIESGCEEYFMEDDGTFSVLCKREDLASVSEFLKKTGLEITSVGLHYIPASKIEVIDFDNALKVIKLLEDLDADEDVEWTWSNESISEEIRKQVSEHIEKNKFRT